MGKNMFNFHIHHASKRFDFHLHHASNRFKFHFFFKLFLPCSSISSSTIFLEPRNRFLGSIGTQISIFGFPLNSEKQFLGSNRIQKIYFGSNRTHKSIFWFPIESTVDKWKKNNEQEEAARNRKETICVRSMLKEI